MKRAVFLAALVACKDVSSWGTTDDHYEGAIVASSFVRAGLAEDTRLCLTLDANRLLDAPGVVTSSDGRFTATPMRPIPQAFHDQLSTLSFGEGRTRNLIYAASEAGGDVTLFVSLMQSGDVEVRLMRGAPGSTTDAGAGSNLFGVFVLTRTRGACAL